MRTHQTIYHVTGRLRARGRGHTATEKNLAVVPGYVPCQSCGVKVRVPDGFVGCVFCADCRNDDTNWTATTEDFMPRTVKY